MRSRIQSIVCVLAVLAFAPIAQAHAFLDHSDPAVGSTLAAAPKEVKIWFTRALEGALSSISVNSADGTEVDKQDSHLDDKDQTLMSVSLKDVGPGTYKVHWHAVCTDTHLTEGSFEFTIKPKG